MVESAALLVDDVLRGYPIRQWVLSLPIPLRLLLARYPCELGKVMSIVHRAISTYIIQRAGFANKHAKTGAITLIQRFGSALNLNIHSHSAPPCASPLGQRGLCKSTIMGICHMLLLEGALS